MGENVLVGFRFYPSEEELLCFYLNNKLNGVKPDIDRIIPLLNVYDYSPWDLPQNAGEVSRGDSERQWFFFSEKQEREGHGGRPNRRTDEGYWKASGSPCDIYSRRNLRIGRKRTMVFYQGRAPTGTKTDWKMNEYKLYHQPSFKLKEELSLCRIYKRSKCKRSFNRLPQTEAVAAALDEEAMRYHQNTDDEVLMAIDNQENVGVETEFNWDMETEIEPLNDSDKLMLLNCFDIS